MGIFSAMVALVLGSVTSALASGTPGLTMPARDKNRHQDIECQ
jgi:hypothetical protein